MITRLIVGNRQDGKSTELIKYSITHNIPIVVRNIITGRLMYDLFERMKELNQIDSKSILPPIIIINTELIDQNSNNLNRCVKCLFNHKEEKNCSFENGLRVAVDDMDYTNTFVLENLYNFYIEIGVVSKENITITNPILRDTKSKNDDHTNNDHAIVKRLKKFLEVKNVNKCR